MPLPVPRPRSQPPTNCRPPHPVTLPLSFIPPALTPPNCPPRGLSLLSLLVGGAKGGDSPALEQMGRCSAESGRGAEVGPALFHWQRGGVYHKPQRTMQGARAEAGGNEGGAGTQGEGGVRRGPGGHGWRPYTRVAQKGRCRICSFSSRRGHEVAFVAPAPPLLPPPTSPDTVRFAIAAFLCPWSLLRYHNVSRRWGKIPAI